MLTQPLTRSLVSPLTRAVTEGGGGGIAIPMTPAVDTPTITSLSATPTFPTATLHTMLRTTPGDNNTPVDMVNDTKFRYPGLPDGVIGPSDAANFQTWTAIMPGGAAQARQWDMQIEFVTSSQYVALSIVPSSNNPGFLILVNGRWVSEAITSTITTAGGHLQLQFPDQRPRTIKCVFSGRGARLGGVRTESAYPPARTASAGKTLLCIGDSLSAGSGSPPTGANFLNVWPQAVATMLGYDHACNASIGGTSWVPPATGTADALISDFGGGRLSPALGINPDAIVFMGSRNDTDTSANITAKVTSVLGGLTGYSKVYVAGTITNLPQNAAVKAGTLAAGRPFVDLSDLITGTGKTTAPTGDGNADIYIGADGIHPVFVGAQYIRQNFALRLRGAGAHA